MSRPSDRSRMRDNRRERTDGNASLMMDGDEFPPGSLSDREVNAEDRLLLFTMMMMMIIVMINLHDDSGLSLSESRLLQLFTDNQKETPRSG